MIHLNNSNDCICYSLECVYFGPVNDDDLQKPLRAEVPDVTAEGQERNYAFLLTAAASVLWIKPIFLDNLVRNMETELLKIERLAMFYSQ